MVKISTRCKYKTSILFALVIISIIAYLGVINNDYKNVKAHNQQSKPIEMYSLWNNTIPTFDGLINFNSSSLSTEWSSAAVYNLFDKDNMIDSKLIIKNDNTNLYVALDLTSYQIETPVNDWGSIIYFDVNHNGILENSDVGVGYYVSGTVEYVHFYQFNELSNQWEIIESGNPGVALTNNIIVNSFFGSSFFESNNHRHYEFKIPFNVFNKIPGEIIGVGFESFEDYENFNEELTWPYVSSTPSEIRINAKFWGDLFLSEELAYSKFSIENNFNIKESAIGINNGCFITSGDIDGDSDQELIVVSNRSVTDDSKLYAIYDYVDNEFTQIWNSWTSSHYSKLISVKDLVAYDFDGDSEDEIYGVGEDSRIERISNWNPSINDFDKVDFVFTHSRSLMGYIAIGDADNEGGMNLVVGDQSGYILILDYDNVGNKFEHDKKSPFLPTISLLNPADRIHAIEVADMDSDGNQEILAFLQTSSNNDLSPIIFNVFERGVAKIYRNDEDDIPYYGSELTEDYFGHTIVVEDVDNDGTVETILASKNYLRIFGANTFDDSTPPLEIHINDGSNPSMGGGAFVYDFDDDGFNELIFGFNNGTIVVMNITDSGGDVLSYSIEWLNDLGSSPGKRNGFISYDIDSDSETEIIFSDNFGQIFILGKSESPNLVIISPTTGYTTNQPTVQITWDATDDHAIHHIDVFVEGMFINRLSGSQKSIRVPNINPTNLIDITAFDVNGKNSTDSIEVIYDVFAPEIFITNPSNNYYTKLSNVLLEFYNFDPDDNFDYYEIYRNDLLIEENYNDESYDMNLPTQGIFNITIIGYDKDSNKGKSSVFVTCDYTPPYIDITNPIFGSYESSSLIDLRWTSSDLYSEVSHFDIYLNGGFIKTTTLRHEIILLDIDRYYLIEVRAFDILGNNKSDTVSFTKDSISPNVSILSHTTDSIIQTSTINLVWTTNDNYQGSGIQYSEVYLNQELKYSGTSSSLLLNLGEDGLKDIRVVAYDRAGNSKSVVIFITLDQQGPAVEILTPIDNYNTSLSYIPLSWYAQDNGTGISEFQILIDGIIVQNITNVDTRSFLLDIPLDKSSIITVRAIDMLNHIAEDSITINHNSSIRTLEIINPIQNMTYLNYSEIEVIWAYQNIENIISIDLFVNGTNVFSTSDIGIYSYLVDLSFIPIDIFPEINITIAYFTDYGLYTKTKWIIVDLINPDISIITPTNNSIIYQQYQYIQWSGFDHGVGLKNYELTMNYNSLLICYCLRNYYYLTFNQGDGSYFITLIARDKAGNKASITFILIVEIQLPIINTNLSSIYYTPTGEFQFSLNIIDPQAGVQKYQILLDTVDICSAIYYPDFITEATTFLINVTADDYLVLEGSHTLQIIIVDALNREYQLPYTIIVDNESPIIQPIMYFDDRVISNNRIDVEIKEDNSQNIHSIRITVFDNELIEIVLLTITGDDYLQSYEMERLILMKSETASYEITLNLTGIVKGSYQIVIQAFDYAGNSHTIDINLSVKYERVLPWFLQGIYAIYFALVILSIILMVIFLIVGINKSMQNRNWKDDIISIIYIKSTGLAAVSRNYKPKIMQEDQLIGGAMVAIQGILEEIIGSKKFKIDIMNLGMQSLLISRGGFGLAALIVEKIKPIHKKKIIKFIKEFEKNYEEALKTLYFVDSTSFDKSYYLIDKYFGTVPHVINGVIQNGISQKLLEHKKALTSHDDYQFRVEDTKQQLFEEKTPIDQLLEQISREAKNQLMKITEKAPKIILSIVESKFDEAEELSNKIINNLDFLLRIERSNVELQLFIQNMMNFIKEANQAIKSGRMNDKVQLQQSLERASQIWFEEFAEKWSNVF